MKRFLLFALLSYCSGMHAHGDDEIMAPGQLPVKLADGFSFTEGPACDAAGNVFFTDQPNDKILKWSVDGQLSTFLAPSGRSNGLCFDPAGDLWACADNKNELWKIDPAGKIEVIVKEYGGKLLNGPNDVWIHPGSGAYFTDPYYKRDYWTRGGVEQEGECVFYLAPDHQTLTKVIIDFVKPNGLIGTPDGKILYVSDFGGHKTWRYEVAPDGSLKNKTLFCELGSDGMTIDDCGNVYLTGKGVTIFNPAGKQIAHIDLPDWTGNVCFGGKDRRTLFITASKNLFAVPMKARGVGSQ